VNPLFGALATGGAMGLAFAAACKGFASLGDFLDGYFFGRSDDGPPDSCALCGSKEVVCGQCARKTIEELGDRPPPPPPAAP
jgi:hypothetical protein